MKEKFLVLIFTFTALAAFTVSASAQRNVTPAIDRDPLLEADAKHNWTSPVRPSHRSRKHTNRFCCGLRKLTLLIPSSHR
ncbi:MAG: hypothetical protein IPP63_18990 [Chloracidobacterium sp.]|nr:hypothetical protein [Chloracidobacterium sp.]